MGKRNPVRNQYMLQGLDLVNAGIINGLIVDEASGVPLPVDDPREARWITNRRVTNAIKEAARTGVVLSLDAADAGSLLQHLLSDPKAAWFTTEAFITKFSRDAAFAHAETERLVANHVAVKAA